MPVLEWDILGSILTELEYEIGAARETHRETEAEGHWNRCSPIIHILTYVI